MWVIGRFLGVTTAARDPLAPTVPAISETYPNFDIGIFFGLMAPKNTPPSIIATLIY